MVKDDSGYFSELFVSSSLESKVGKDDSGYFCVVSSSLESKVGKDDSGYFSEQKMQTC